MWAFYWLLFFVIRAKTGIQWVFSPFFELRVFPHPNPSPGVRGAESKIASS